MAIITKSGARARRGAELGLMLFNAGRFRIQRLAIVRGDGYGKRQMWAARQAFYESLWRTASAAIGASTTVDPDGVIEMRRGELCFKALGNETQVDDQGAMARAGNKLVTHRLLSQGGIPVPGHVMVKLGEYDRALRYLTSKGGPVVVKPAASTGGGAGVTTNVFTPGQLRSAMSWSRTYGKDILVEQQIEGDCYRILLMDGKHIDSVLRRPPTVLGDGRCTIAQLLRNENRRRIEQGAARAQALISVDRDLANTLARQGFGLELRPAAGAVVRLKQVINDNALHENSPASDLLCVDIVASARKAAELVGARYVGVDVICRDPSLALEASGGAVIEVNTQPGLVWHNIGGRGPSVVKQILELYFGGRSENSQSIRLQRASETALAGSMEQPRRAP